jgi:hypothetical protein
MTGPGVRDDGLVTELQMDHDCDEPSLHGRRPWDYVGQVVESHQECSGA